VIEALLTLARSERGLDERMPFDLAELADEVLAGRQDEAAQRRIDVHPLLETAEAAGEPHLAERLVANLVDNALRHNVPEGGLIEVATVVREGRAVLTIANTGPVVAPEDAERLFRPFERLGRNRIDRSDGVGLGLSIVQAIAAAHGAELTTRPRLGGGLVIEVGFPAPEPELAEAAVQPQPVVRVRRPAPVTLAG
jgi:signal transduction histidine kinase